jgi:hypothetical protein
VLKRQRVVDLRMVVAVASRGQMPPPTPGVTGKRVSHADFGLKKSNEMVQGPCAHLGQHERSYVDCRSRQTKCNKFG